MVFALRRTYKRTNRYRDHKNPFLFEKTHQHRAPHALHERTALLLPRVRVAPRAERVQHPAALLGAGNLRRIHGPSSPLATVRPRGGPAAALPLFPLVRLRLVLLLLRFLLLLRLALRLGPPRARPGPRHRLFHILGGGEGLRAQFLQGEIIKTPESAIYENRLFFERKWQQCEGVLGP